MPRFLQIFEKILYLLIFRQEGRDGEKHPCVVASHALRPTRNLACDPGMCLDWELNQQPFGSQAGTQSTEPHQPGLEPLFLKTIQTFLPGVANIKGPRKYKKMCK